MLSDLGIHCCTSVLIFRVSAVDKYRILGKTKKIQISWRNQQTRPLSECAHVLADLSCCCSFVVFFSFFFCFCFVVVVVVDTISCFGSVAFVWDGSNNFSSALTA